MTKTKGQIEAEISEALIKFEKDYMGRGPEETKTYTIENLVVIRLSGVLTPAEKKLAEADQDGKGRMLIKQVRMELLERGRILLETVIRDITGRQVTSMHTDISTVTGERIIIFVLKGHVPVAAEPTP